MSSYKGKMKREEIEKRKEIIKKLRKYYGEYEGKHTLEGNHRYGDGISGVMIYEGEDR